MKKEVNITSVLQKLGLMFTHEWISHQDKKLQSYNVSAHEAYMKMNKMVLLGTAGILFEVAAAVLANFSFLAFAIVGSAAGLVLITYSIYMFETAGNTTRIVSMIWNIHLSSAEMVAESFAKNYRYQPSIEEQDADIVFTVNDCLCSLASCLKEAEAQGLPHKVKELRNRFAGMHKFGLAIGVKVGSWESYLK